MATMILGAGVAGLLAARKLNERGEDFVVLDKEDEVGGHVRTLRTGRFRWDLGPHALYSKQQEPIDFFRSLRLNLRTHRRTVRICHWGSDEKVYEVDYPFENGLGDLPFDHRTDCLLGYMEAYLGGRSQFQDFRHLQDWIENGLGSGIAKHFMLPYNRKIWSCPLDQISMGLVKWKIDPAPVREVIESCFGRRTVGRTYQAKFQYPADGFGSIGRALAQPFQDRIHLNSEIHALRRHNKRWLVRAGDQTFESERVISTIPLPHLLKLVRINGVHRSYPELKANHTLFLMLGLREGVQLRRFNNKHWIFFAGSEVFYRLTTMHNFSRRFPPAIVAEFTLMSEPSKREVGMLASQAIRDMLRCGMLEQRSDVETTDYRYMPYTYPIPTHGLPELKEELKERFAREGITLLGRAGEWEYVNTDGVYQLVEAAAL
jgi:protoporphyrinogen oxidase